MSGQPAPVPESPVRSPGPVPLGPPAPEAPPALAPPPGNPRFPLIDSLRAMAALCVLVTHTAVFGGFSSTSWTTALWSDLTIGVPIFFVISGFLLYRPFVAPRFLPTRPIGTRGYAWRRFLRIVPAYWLALTVLAWTAHLHGVIGHDWWRYYFFLQVYDRRTLYGGIVPAWTLCVEVTFYALLPVYAAALGRAGAGLTARGRRRLELCVPAMLALASVALRTIDLAGPRTLLPNTLPENFYWFALGMGLAVISVACTNRDPAALRVGHLVARRAGVCWVAAVLLYVVLARLFPHEAVLRGGVFYQTAWGGLAQHLGFGVIAIALVAPAVFPRSDSVPARVLRWRALAWLGLVSYGIYLYHDPLLGRLLAHGALGWWPHHPFVVLTALTATGAIVAATLSYYVFERPILSLKAGRPR